MTREIKFKAYHKPTKRIFDVYSFSADLVFEDSLDGIGTSATFPAKRQDCVLMQFTGYFDKNGKEIYEGDVVKMVYYPLGGRREIYEYSHIRLVEFKDGSFGIVSKLKLGIQLQPDKCMSHETNEREIYKHPTTGLDYFSRDLHIEHHRLEIIGNIYENPQLINE